MPHNEPASVTAPQVLTKQPGELRRFSMEFANLLATSETISSPTITSAPEGNDTNPGLTIGTASVSGSQILFDISVGTHPIRYRVEVTVTTSGGATLVGDGILKVVDK